MAQGCREVGAQRMNGLARRLFLALPILTSALVIAWLLSPRLMDGLICVLVTVIGSARSLLRRDSWTSADDLTTLRLGFIVIVTALFLADDGPGFTWTAVVLGATALAMDGLDGKIARSTGSTRAGALYDEAVDALFILILSMGLVPLWGPWCLIPGLMYYAFHLMSAFRPTWRRQLPKSLSRRVIAAAQGILLLAAGTPIAVAIPAFGVLCVATAVVSVLYSFGRDILWLERRRAAS
ncbi:CDP-alcohol phosphatidyltransferase family protein [Kocuria carniphila]|uniref:CDP-alcohol phosphatidyltransferase family protein n=1 Tax=Kocuria carniphila TaxID=262208 RepID=UPI0028E1EE05|nr:CDP-alcohol phosphatidyltransferase family protein [Kocuria carniphila]